MSNINLEKYLVCEFSMLLKDFSVKYGSASFFYRKLTKSNCSVGGRKNKDFFSKYFSGGFYTFFRVPTEIQIIILLKARKELTQSIQSSIKVRVRKMVLLRDVKTYSISDIQSEGSSDANKLIDNLNEFKCLLQPFGDEYNKKRCSENFLFTSEN